MSRCFLLLVDGLRPDVAERRLASGDLPHIAAMLKQGGRTRAITGFPSTTSVAYLPFLTGCTPGHCDIPSIRWLDRSAYGGRWWRDRNAIRSYCGYQAPMLDGDIRDDVRTIFELVPDSIGIFTPVARGLSRDRDPSRRERQVWGSLAHVSMWHQPSDDAVSRHLLKAAAGKSRFVFAQFPAVDGFTHQSGADSAPVHRALARIDADPRPAARAAHEEERTTRQPDPDRERPRRLCCSHPPRSCGLVPDPRRPYSRPSNRVGEKPSAAVMVAGNGSAMVYARPGEPRSRSLAYRAAAHT